MKIERPTYLNELIRSRGNGSIKIITGLHRCGKSYLLKTLFKEHLLKEGIPAEHIIVIDLEDRKQAAFKDPDYLMDYVDKIMKDNETYYIFIVGSITTPLAVCRRCSCRTAMTRKSPFSKICIKPSILGRRLPDRKI